MRHPAVHIDPPTGKLGVLLVGLGAVSTTFIAGVLAIEKGLAPAVGSLTQTGTLRLGKRTDNRAPAIRDFVPLANLQDLVFGAWDIFEDNAFEAASTAGVLEPALLAQLREPLTAIKPMSAVFDRRYVSRLDGPNVKQGNRKRDLIEQLRADIRLFKREHKVERLVVAWCGSTEAFMAQAEAHQSLQALEDAI